MWQDLTLIQSKANRFTRQATLKLSKYHTVKMELLSSQDLARIAREERTKRELTQAQVAELVSKRTDTRSCTKQAVSQAENLAGGSKMDGLRLKIIETLTGKKLTGPLWHFK